jgi:hypothetical protein
MVRGLIHNVQRRPSSMRDDRGIDSTYTPLHVFKIRWGRCPTAPFLSLVVVHDVCARSIVGVSSMKQTTAVVLAPTSNSLDGCATSRARERVGDDRSRAMSLAFDEFGRPFIIIKVRARPRRERGGRARERATRATTTTRDPSSIDARAFDDDDDDDARTGRGLTGTTRAGTREKVSRSWNRGAAREHRGGEERGEDVEVVSGTKGARVDFFAARRRVDSRRRGKGLTGDGRDAFRV